MREPETRKLYEVKDEVFIGRDEYGQDILLEPGTRFGFMTIQAMNGRFGLISI